MPFARPRIARSRITRPSGRPPSRLRAQLEHRIYDTTPPRPIRLLAAALSWRLRRIARPAPVFVVGGDKTEAHSDFTGTPEIVAYFAEGKTRLYQLQQWLPVLEQLAETRPVLVVTRREESWESVLKKTKLPAALVPTFRDLYELYERVDAKVALYVNNGGMNFQSLGATRMLHVHINHGESDKLSMVSNQAKAYDRVFVAGQAAVLRHRAALLEMDETKLIKVGRPQLDLELPPALPESERRTVLYAPTWEGENDANNYTSLDMYGEAITAAVLGQPDVRLVYKPHPRIPSSNLPQMVEMHESVCRMIGDALRRVPSAGHVIAEESTNILALLKQADLLISDVSSVTLDFLYLRNEQPLLLTDRRNDRDQLRMDAPVSNACDVIDATSVEGLPELVAKTLAQDDHRDERQRMREFYFGELRHGESTERFLEEISTLVQLRDKGLTDRGTLISPVARGFEGAVDDPDQDRQREERGLTSDDEMTMEEPLEHRG